MPNNVFILSMGRSGTTLLQSILDAHPHIVSPPESDFMLHLYTRYKDEKQWTQKTVDRFIADLYTDRSFRLFWKVPRADVEASIKKAGKILSYADACNAVRMSFEKAYENDQLKLIGDKKPSNWMFIDRILRVHENTKIVHLIRDPRGVCNGQIHTFRRKDALALGVQWTILNGTVRQLQKTLPEQYYLLRYEDLVANPSGTIQLLCEFLEIEYSETMMNYREGLVSAYFKYSESYRAKHENLLKPIDPEIAERWKKTLTPRHRRYVEYTTQQLAAEFGYDFERPTPNFGLRFKTGLGIVKIWSRRVVIRLFFSLPILIRKVVLNIRSRNTDHLYTSNS